MIAVPARGEGAPAPTYGRIDGDLGIVIGAGAVVSARGVRAEGELRLRYLDTAGVLLTYEEGAGSAAEPRRCLVAGFELRPVFLARWLRSMETEKARFDLTLDSIGLEIAAVWMQPEHRGFGASAGLQIGLGLEVPLTGAATGPWIGIRGGLRFSDDAMAYGSVQSAEDRAAYLAVTLAWHEMVSAHLVDMGDEAPR